MIRLVAATVVAGSLTAQDTHAARVAALLARVDRADLQRTVTDLVAFGTRHVRSTTDAEAAGTGAARAYLEQRLRTAGAPAGDRLQVERRAYRVHSTRLRGEVEVVNVLATLRGVSDPARVYVIGGHYD